VSTDLSALLLSRTQISAADKIEQHGSRYGNIEMMRDRRATTWLLAIDSAHDADFRLESAFPAYAVGTQEAVMLHRDHLNIILSSSAFSADETVRSTRRGLVLAPLFAALSLALSVRMAHASKISTSETAVTLPDDIKWSGWIKGFPPHSGEMATLYGSLEEPGPYVVLMKWYPGYMSAPHTYATDRLSLVLSGTWWVNSGPDFDPENTVPVPAGGFVRRIARTPHYDGVRQHASAPAVIGLFGIAPVEFQLVDASKPAWRRV
jgi:hypothetical protein